jgi:hypothetical protein
VRPRSFNSLGNHANKTVGLLAGKCWKQQILSIQIYDILVYYVIDTVSHQCRCSFLFLTMSTFNPNELFDPKKYCPMSRTLHHRDVKEPRCNMCERLSPNREGGEVSGKKHAPALPGPEDEYIEIPSSPLASSELSEAIVSSAPPPPGRRDRGANHIPDLAVGIGGQGRREAIKGAQDRKIKSGFTNNPALTEKVFIFVVSAAHYCSRPAGWKKSPTNWMHSERDRPLTSTELLDSLLEGVRAKVTRNEYTTWLAPSKPGNWSLFLFASCVVEPWAEAMTITQMLELRPFKVASDNKRR